MEVHQVQILDIQAVDHQMIGNMKNLLIILSMIVCNACYGQIIDSPYVSDGGNWSEDTVRLLRYNHGVFMVSDLMLRDTILPPSNVRFDSVKFEGNGVAHYYRKRDTVEVRILISADSLGPLPFILKCYSVRELHNTSEGIRDPYFCANCTYTDYWQHIYYLNKDKNRLSKNIIIWQSKEVQ